MEMMCPNARERPTPASHTRMQPMSHAAGFPPPPACIGPGTGMTAPFSRREMLRVTGTAVGAAASLVVPRLVLAARAFASLAPSPVVQTSHGPVRGEMEGDVHVFRGIPYGADTARR